MKCFVIMPFDEEFSDVYATIVRAVKSAVPDEEIQCFRLDEIKSAGRITDDLVRELQEAAVCIADLSGSTPNVMWEVGYAMALRKPMLFVSQEIKSLPFDIRQMRTVPYDRASLAASLEGPLRNAFRATLGTYAIERRSATVPLPQAAVHAVSVTGSMQANDAQVHRRLTSLLKPYLGSQVTWYCGSYGDVDEAAVRYLVENNEKVVVVGYDAYDISETMLDFVKQHGIPFVDAEREQLPQVEPAPTRRDVLFLTKADLVILLWNRESAGTLEMIEWYRDNGKDHVVGFV